MKATFFILACLVVIASAELWQREQGGEEGHVIWLSLPTTLDVEIKKCIYKIVGELPRLRNDIDNCRSRFDLDNESELAAEKIHKTTFI